jgi:hypothetical protein
VFFRNVCLRTTHSNLEDSVLKIGGGGSFMSNFNILCRSVLVNLIHMRENRIFFGGGGPVNSRIFFNQGDKICSYNKNNFTNLPKVVELCIQTEMAPPTVFSILFVLSVHFMP